MAIEEIVRKMPVDEHTDVLRQSEAVCDRARRAATRRARAGGADSPHLNADSLAAGRDRRSEAVALGGKLPKGRHAA